MTWNSEAPPLIAPSIRLTGAQTLDVIPTPAAPPAGRLAMWAESVGGRVLPRVMGPSGLDTTLQPFLARNKIRIWNVPGGATTVPGVFGYTALTAVGTATSRTVAATNLFTRASRLGYVSTAAAAAVAGGRVAVAQITTGTGTIGGFHKICRFGISDAAYVNGSRMFVGVSNLTNAPTDVNPATLTQCIGVGHNTGDTTMRVYFGGTAAGTPVDLGANFPANTTNTDLYELMIFCPPTGGCTWQVTRLNTGNTATGTIPVGTNLPASTVLLSYQRAWRSTGTGTTAVGLDLVSDYVETDV